jgi:hypothetical protein
MEVDIGSRSKQGERAWREALAGAELPKRQLSGELFCSNSLARGVGKRR